MKLLFLLFSLLLLSYAATSSLDGEPVLDSDGDELQAGQLYYATSQVWGALGGGLELVSLDKSRCPLYAAKAAAHDVLGQPLAFFPEDPLEHTVREGRALYIMFVVPTACPESTVWHYNSTGDYVTTGGTTSPVRGPRFSWFALNQKGDKVYGIKPIPGVVQFDTLGLDEVNGKILLRVKYNFPSLVTFQKATKKTSTIPSVVGGSEA